MTRQYPLGIYMQDNHFLPIPYENHNTIKAFIALWFVLGIGITENQTEIASNA